MSLSRDFTADLEIRSDGTGRTIHGIVVPYGVSARVSDGGAPYLESFQKGAFAHTLANRRSPVKLLSQHDHRNPIGVMTSHRADDDAGLYAEFRVSNTAAANDQLELARDGVLDSFSVGFAPVKHVKRGETTVRTEVNLREVSLVTFPAYDGAVVAGVRALDNIDLDATIEALLGFDAEHLISLRERLDAALSRLGTPPDGAAPDADLPAGVPNDAPLGGQSGRLLVARNNLRAALIERGIRP